MSIIANTLYRHIHHGLGGDPSSEFPYQEIVNDAGEWLLSVHRWNWNTPETTTIDTTVDVPYIAMPSDFADLIDIQATNNITSSVTPVTRAKLLEFRTNTVAVTNFTFFYSVGFRKVSGVMSPVLELWPTPSASESDKFTILYCKGWTRVTDDDDVIEAPGYMEPLLKRVCRVFAQGVEEEQQGAQPGARVDVDDLLSRVMAGPLWESATNQDASIQTDLGPMTGGHLMGLPHRTASHFLSTEVQPPS